jgi:hypothetical protein
LRLKAISKDEHTTGGLNTSGGVTSQKRQCDFGSFVPARASVSPPLLPSRWDVIGNAREAVLAEEVENDRKKLKKMYKLMTHKKETI